jgi:hypothetical protein
VSGGAAGAEDPLRAVVVLVAIVMPIALFWVAALAASSARIMREESARLQAAIDTMRQAYVAQSQTAHMGLRPSSVERKLDQIMAAQSRQGGESAFAAFASIREAKDRVTAALPPPAEVQPSFALVEAPEPASEVTIADFVTALNFPETPEDRDGFRALRRAMQDRRAAELITASQDVLTLLSQEGIYMDDLTPDRARPEIWRRFAEGQRGKPIATLGGIRDRSCLALTAARMRNDPIFRDAVHHFLRKFDRMFSEFEKHATDAEIAALAKRGPRGPSCCWAASPASSPERGAQRLLRPTPRIQPPPPAPPRARRRACRAVSPLGHRADRPRQKRTCTASFTSPGRSAAFTSAARSDGQTSTKATGRSSGSKGQTATAPENRASAARAPPCRSSPASPRPPRRPSASR